MNDEAVGQVMEWMTNQRMRSQVSGDGFSYEIDLGKRWMEGKEEG
jgi:hypothetical protein